MKIRKLQLYTAQLHELKIFYVNILGFDLYNEKENSFTLKAGSSLLEFIWADPTQPAPSYHFAFNIPENQLEECKRWLYSKSVRLEKYEENDIVDFPKWNAKAVYFIDPSQNIVEFIARHDLNNASEYAFGASSITEISEIGLPVPQIAPFYQQISEILGIQMYSEASNQETFCAAGDPEGLFIIVPLERNWFPTELVNGVHPVIITLGTGANEEQEKKFDGLPYVLKI